MKTKLLLTLLVVVGLALFLTVYAPAADVIKAQSGVGQLSNDPVGYITAREFGRTGLIVNVALALTGFVLALIWAPLLWKLAKRIKVTNSALVLFLVISIALTGCKPYKGTKVVEIAPNQTAFLLPAVGDTTAQAKFDSVGFLQTNQVAAKIVEISYREHKIGRFWWQIDFVPNQILILVDRSPESRQWTYDSSSPNSSITQAIALESKESIGFYHGVVVNALIEEDDAATFLYYYGGAGSGGDIAATGVQLTVGLDHVMDSFVRTWVADKLYAEFKALTLEDCQEEAANIFARIEEQAHGYFKTYGITILDLGGIEGLVFDSDEVQNTINQKFEVAAKATSQAIDNQKQIDIAKAQIQVGEAQATQTVVAAQALAESLHMQGEELAKYPDLVNYTLAQKSRGNVPSVLVNGQDGYQMPFPFWFYYGAEAQTAQTTAPEPVLQDTVTPTPSQ